ncbi:MAG: DNA mismatch repair endonuclease MutL [Alphaproteobacteria bacterium]
MNIRILPQNLINQIAAGEVIERPFSVIKELTENAIDAKATQIDIQLFDGGKTNIIITDNGKGMNEDDLKLSIHPHATSKLADDNLFAVKYLGFRGEALASISSVAKLTITTRTKKAENAIQLDASTMQIKPASGQTGTKIEVKDLFYTTPARLKFLKSDNYETSSCVEVINKLAMANPQIGFKLTANDKVKINYAPVLERSSRLFDVMDKDFATNSIAISAQNSELKISGYIGLPTLSKSNSLSQYLFVNNRFVKDKLLMGTIKGAYQDVLERGKYPAVAIFIDILPELVDVNVHPQKAEVRFFDNQMIRGMLFSSIQRALEIGSQKSAIHINKPIDMSMPKATTQNTMFFHDSQRVIDSSLFSVKTDEIITAPPEEEIGFLGMAKAQFNNTYIISQTQDGITIIDQHAAHERIVLEKMKEQIKKNIAPSQMLLIPEVIELPSLEKEALLSMSEELKKIGFDIEDFGTTAVLIREVPALIANADIKNLIKKVAEESLEFDASYAVEKKLHDICATIACHGSVRAGRDMNTFEMNQLLRDMEKTNNSGQCNHGRPTYVELKTKDIERLFLR